MKKWFKGFMAVTLASVVLAGCGSNATGGQTDGKDGSADGKKKLVISTWGFSEDFLTKKCTSLLKKNITLISWSKLEITLNG